jgi:hypothetical protein
MEGIMKSDRFRLQLYLVIFILLLFCGMIGFAFFENLSLVDAAYFSIVTMATVGYGDIHPQTGIGKILALVLIIGGVGTFLGVVASITDLFFNRREQDYRNQKRHMMTSLFFSELGNGLLRRLTALDPAVSELHAILKVSDHWQDKDFLRAKKRLAGHTFSIDIRNGDVPELLTYLKRKTRFLLRLLENPFLQEHGRFTDLLVAVFHLRDELINRQDLATLSDVDRSHLEGDINRIYQMLVAEWLDYMQYLKGNYPYLLSLAIRVNPFDPGARAEVAG